MARWKIHTSGPLLDFEGTLEEAMHEVERGATLKRGWTRKWVDGRSGRRYLHRYNSKGRFMHGYTIMLLELPPR